MLPLAYDFFLGFQQFGADRSPMRRRRPPARAHGEVGIQFLGTINEYLSLTMKFIIAFGLCFQLPVAADADGQGRAGHRARASAGFRRYAIVLILIVAAIVTPPDVMSQLILFAAIYPLYEISILLIRRIEKKREAELRAAGPLGRRPDEDAADRARRDRGDGALARIADGAGAAEPAARAGAGFRRRRGLRLARRAPTGWSRCARVARVEIGAAGRRRPGARHAARQHAAVRRAACPPTTCCSGARAAWASRASSRRSTPRPRREAPGLKLVELHREDLPSIGRLLALLRGAPSAVPPVLRRPVASARTTSTTSR